MDIIQGFIETGNAGKSGWKIVNNKGAFGVVNKKTSNVSYSILNSGTIGTGSTFINTYSSTPTINASPSATTTGTTGAYTYQVFTYTTETAGTGTGQTQYTINVPTGSLTCDILMVGGGGAGGGFVGPGGGGGAVLYGTNIVIQSGSYTIKVGKGATSANSKGFNTEGFGAIILGGGSAQTSFYAPALSNSGGSGSGGQSTGGSFNTGGSIGISSKGTILSSATLYNGNIGGSGVAQGSPAQQAVSSGGGGGAGTAGQIGTRDNTKRGAGGDGVLVNIIDVNYYWGAGGGAGAYNTSAGNGGLGGGGGGINYNGGYSGSIGIVGGSAYSYDVNSINAGNGTGSGGGGGGDGGNGGSGIVIIRYLTPSSSSSISLIQEPTLNVITNYVGGVTSIGGGSSQWTTISGSKIYYNDGNVGVGTIDPIAPLQIYNNTTTPTLPTEIVVAGTTSGTIAGTTDRYISFPYSGSGTTKDYTFTTTENLICDILIVGGGGAGGRDIGAGGGGGAVLYGTNINIPSSTYTIKVGRGATPGETRGASSEGFGATILGGGSAINAVWATTNNSPNGNSGGSGGGGKGVQAGGTPGIGGTVGISTKGTILNASTLYNGNIGGFGQAQGPGVSSGGGGGAGGVGGNGYNQMSGGNGGIGVPINITGAEYYWGSGGGAGCHEGTPGNGGLGGGGAGSTLNSVSGVYTGSVGGSGYGIASGKHAGAGTGSGGGGVNVQDSVGGNGGSGIIIIRYRRQTQPTVSNSRLLLDTTTSGTATVEFRRGTGVDAQNDYRFINDSNESLKLQCENSTQVFGNTIADLAWFSSNDTIIHKNTTMNGRVGIGTIPSRTLDIVGDANISGVLTAGSLSASSATITNSITSNTSLNITNGFVTTLPNEIAVPSPIPNEIVVSPLPTEIVVTGTTFGTIGTTDRYISFPYSGTGATKDYTFTTTENLICDILIVGGGGGGGSNSGGGGGAGGVVIGTNVVIPGGNYSIKIGNGGIPSSTANNYTINGNDSSITIGGTTIIAKGGGGGVASYLNGAIGGSGGGGSTDNNTNSTSAISNQLSTQTLTGYGINGVNVTFNGYGNAGGIGRYQEQGGWTRASAGGGGAGSAGYNSGDYILSDLSSPARITQGGRGGEGRDVSSIFGTNIGVNGFVGGGGGGSTHRIGISGSGGSGGGGSGGIGRGTAAGGTDPGGNGVSGTPNTGGGGGGGGGGGASGGSGGSGIVIIRYRKPPSETVVSGTIAGTTDRYISFPYSGNGATKDYTITTTENLLCDILIVGGGGGGGASIGSGGGGGGLLYYTGLTITANTYTISVGNGGTGATNYLARGANGSNSSAVGYTAYGGGGGGGQSWVYNQSNTAGGTLQTTSANQGSGGGGTRYKTLGNSGTSGQGNSGGNASPDQMIAGGGGGAGGVGGTAQNTVGGIGGIGTYNSIIGSSIGYAGGGAGSGGNEIKYGALATEGGGNSGPINGSGGFLIGGAGTNGRGGGGGGGVDSGGVGGSGIVIIRYRKPPSETVTSSIITGTTDRYIQFPYSGTASTKDYTITTTENIVCDILVVGGGGSGGAFGGGGGGGGDVIYQQNISLSFGTYNINVGRGGTSTTGSDRGNNGDNSSINGTGFTTITAVGGGGGAGYNQSSIAVATIGTSSGGGGGGTGQNPYTAGATSLYSGAGGNGVSSFLTTSGGGGGSVGVGGTATIKSKAGNGGIGNDISIIGISQQYGGGGGGGNWAGEFTYTAPNIGGGTGVYGGGNGAYTANSTNYPAINGTPNTGGGGGGGGGITAGGIGGSGIVIIRYRRQSSNQSAALELTSSSTIPIIDPVAKGIKQFPETPSTNADSWTDNGFTVTCKTSDAILSPQNTFYLFNNLIASPDHYHGAQLFNASSPFNYTSSTSFKGANGLVLYIDLGRSITLRNMRMAPRDNASHPGLNFIGAMPGVFKIYASNDSAAWTSTTHASWTEIHSQTTSLTFNYNQFTSFGNFSSINTPYRYFAMVVYNLSGNYSYLTFSEWDLFGTYDMTPVVINSDYKYLSFTYYPTVVEQKTGVSGWRLVRFLPPTATAWHPVNDNLAGTTTYGTAYNYTNAWSIPFGTFDEFCFGTLNLQYWMRITKTAAIGATYDGANRSIISSSFSSTPYTALQYYRAGNPEDPWMSIRDHGTGGAAAQIVYGENSSTANTPLLIPVDGGMGVWVRNSAETLALPSQTSYTVNFPESTLCDILVVGGGGGGGYSYVGGGGGGGGYVYLQNISVPSGNYTVNVGGGGTAGINGASPAGWGGNGANSSITGAINYIALGGGAGAGGSASGVITGIGNNGGSGGGGSYRNIGSVAAAGGTSTQFSTYGYGTGGSGNGYGSPWQYGGGGGGASGTTNGTSATGNNGLANSITGSSITYAGGGGGGVDGTSPSLGGSGGGGGGANQSGTPTAAVAGTDGLGGGGGGSSTGAAAKGGSGIVIIRYKSTKTGNQTYKVGNYSGEFKVISSVSSQDTDYIKITSAGAITNPMGTASWNIGSDRRIKENIERASYDKCYENINKLELNRFNYVSGFNTVNPDKTQLGFIAQEVSDIFPKSISSQEYYSNTLNIPDLLSIDITQINYSLYGAVKKLIEINIEKDIRIITLNNRIKILKTLLNITDDAYTSNIILGDESGITITENLTSLTSNTSNLVIDVTTSNIVAETIVIDATTSNIVADTIVIDDTTSNITSNE
jgi:hypothetical protein